MGKEFFVWFGNRCSVVVPRCWIRRDRPRDQIQLGFRRSGQHRTHGDRFSNYFRPRRVRRRSTVSRLSFADVYARQTGVAWRLSHIGAVCNCTSLQSARESQFYFHQHGSRRRLDGRGVFAHAQFVVSAWPSLVMELGPGVLAWFAGERHRAKCSGACAARHECGTGLAHRRLVWIRRRRCMHARIDYFNSRGVANKICFESRRE